MGGGTTTTAAISQNKAAFRDYIMLFEEGCELEIYLIVSSVNVPAQKNVKQVVEQPSLIDEVPVPETATF